MFLCLFDYLLDYERKTRIFTSFFEMSTNKKAMKRTNSERLTAIFWSRIRDSNPPPTAWEAVALPDELTLQVLHYCNKAGQECQGFSARNLRSAHFGPCQIQHRENGSNTKSRTPFASSRRFCCAIRALRCSFPAAAAHTAPAGHSGLCRSAGRSVPAGRHKRYRHSRSDCRLR